MWLLWAKPTVVEHRLETKGLINDMDGNVLFYFVFNQTGIVSDTATPVLQLKKYMMFTSISK